MLLRRFLVCSMFLSLAYLGVQATVTVQKTVTQPTKKIATPPAKAASTQSKKATEKTAERKATKSVDTITPKLIQAVINGNLENVKKYSRMKEGNVNAKIGYEPLLVYAVNKGSAEIVKALLAAPNITINKNILEAAEKSHADQRREIYHAIIDKWKKLGQSLLEAVDKNDIAGVKKAVEHGAFIYNEKLNGYKELARDDDWNTPLLNAIRTKKKT